MRTFPLAVALLLALAGSAGAQSIPFDRPKLYVRKEPPTRQELDQRQSLYQYVFGLALVHDERYAEALKAFEEAARLDPEAPALFKAQAPILIGLGRYGDALAACKKVVALDPEDYPTWYVQAKLFKTLLKYDDAIAALKNGLKSAAIKNHPEAAHLLYAELGGLCEATDQFAAAADAYHQAAALLEHPDQIAEKGHVPRAVVVAKSAETYERIGLLYRKAKRHDDAIASLRKAQEYAPQRSARLSFTLAQICEEQGSLKQALVFVDDYLCTQPLSTEPHEMKIRLLRGLKETGAIVPWLEEAAGRERFNTQLQLLLAQECAAARLFAKAEVIYKKLAEDAPSVEVYRGLFNIFKEEKAGPMRPVLQLLDKALDKTARDAGPSPIGTVQQARAMIGALESDSALAQAVVVAAYSQKPDLKFDTVLFLAMLADRNHKNEEAERFYRQCLSAKDLNPVQEAQIYVGLLRVLGNARKHEAMAKVCNEGLVNSHSLKAWVFYKELARAQAALHRYDDALHSLEQGSKQAGEQNRLLFDVMRLRILTAAERYPDAETECLALLKKYDQPAEVLELRYLLSNVYGSNKQQAKAQEQLQLILKIDPDNVAVNNDLGYLWADQGKNLQIAEAMIRKALDIERSQRRRSPDWNVAEDKDNAAYVDSLGWVLFRRGQLDEARKELERAAVLDGGNDPTIHEHLGDVYSRLKMRPEAIRAWQRALELYNQGARGKDDERVRELRRKIEQGKDAN